MTSRKIKYVLIWDITARDFAGIFLVAKDIVKKGHEVIMFPAELLWKSSYNLLHSINPDAVLLHYYRKDNSRAVRKLAASGLTIFVCETEGAVFYNDEDVNGRLPNKLIDKFIPITHFCWGDFFSNCLKSRGVSLKKRMVTGNPRFDLKNHKLQNRNHKNRVCLINSSTPLANNKFTKSTADLMKQQKEKIQYSDEYLNSVFSSQKVIFKNLIIAAKNLAKKMPEITFVFRPHPMENRQLYQNEFKGIPNIKMCKSETIEDSLQNAFCVVHRGCTTAIDAIFSGIPAISLNWIKPKINPPAPELVSFKVDDLKSATTTIKLIFNRKLNFDKKLIEKIDYYIHRPINGSYQAISEIMIKRMVNQKFYVWFFTDIYKKMFNLFLSKKNPMAQNCNVFSIPIEKVSLNLKSWLKKNNLKSTRSAINTLEEILNANLDPFIKYDIIENDGYCQAIKLKKTQE